MGTKTLSQLPVATLAEAENIFHVRQGLADKQMSLPVLSRFVIRDSAYGYQELEITTNTVISEIQRIHSVMKFNSSSAVSCELPFSGDIEAGATVWAYNIGTGTATLTYQSGVSTVLPTGERARLVWNGAAWILDSSTRYAEASEWFRINGGPRIKKGATADALAVRNSTDTDYGDLEVKGLTLHETITADGGVFNTLAVSGAAEFNAPTGAPFSVASSEKVVNLNADKLDGYHANTGSAAGTVPVRDANGKVPGSITGDADTLDGYHANTGSAAGTVPVRDANGKVPGSITGGSELLGGQLIANMAFVDGIMQYLGSVGGGYKQFFADSTTTGMPASSVWFVEAMSNSAGTYITCIIKDFFSKKSYAVQRLNGVWEGGWKQLTIESGNYLWANGVQSTSNAHIDSAEGGLGVYLNWYGGTSGTVFGNGNEAQVGYVNGGGLAGFNRGLKNTLYAVTWTISLTTGREFYIHQPVNVSFSAANPVIAAYANGAWRNIHNDAADSTTNRTYSLAPGQYRNINSGTITMYIGHATSNTQADIITLL